VARVAIDSRMRTGQWKTIIVLLDLLSRHSPSAYGVTLLAICS
jgi:hypothetical protein